MQSEQLVQGSDEWLQARIGKCTGSRFHDACSFTRSGSESANRRNYKYQIIAERLTGQQQDFYSNRAMEWGTATEDSARLAYEFSTGNDVEQVGMLVHPELADVGFSPDGLVGDDGAIEIKCPETATHIQTLTSGKIPAKYMEQVLGVMWVTGRKWCDFISYDPRLPEDLQIITVRLDRDAEQIAELDENIREFLADVDKEYEQVLKLRG